MREAACMAVCKPARYQEAEDGCVVVDRRKQRLRRLRQGCTYASPFGATRRAKRTCALASADRRPATHARRRLTGPIDELKQKAGQEPAVKMMEGPMNVSCFGPMAKKTIFM